MNKIGKNIKILRTSHKLSQDDLAAKLFVSRQTISNYENGKSNPDIDMIIRMGEVFETDANELIYGIRENSIPDRKRDIRKMMVMSVLCLVLFLVVYKVDQEVHVLRLNYFINMPLLLTIEILWPGLYLLIGWTVMFLLQTLTGIKLIRNKPARVVFYTMTALVFYYIIIYFPFWIWEIKQMILEIKLKMTKEEYSISGGFSVFPLWNYLWMKMELFLNNRRELFIVAGIVLCLTRKEKEQKKAEQEKSK